jgi:hypothetical protein
VKRYYLTLSRLSLAVIMLQAFTFLYCGFNVEKINRRIDQAVAKLSGRATAVPVLEAAYREGSHRLARFQSLNREHKWLLQGIVMGGLLHVGICYSLYIHFLRMGYTWTKLCLHANNLSLAIPLPSPANLLWLLSYVIGTRIYKHYCVACGFHEPCTRT